MKEYKVMAANLHATYRAGAFVAETANQACQMAREDYRISPGGRELEDADSFRFYTVSDWPE